MQEQDSQGFAVHDNKVVGSPRFAITPEMAQRGGEALMKADANEPYDDRSRSTDEWRLAALARAVLDAVLNDPETWKPTVQNFVVEGDTFNPSGKGITVVSESTAETSLLPLPDKSPYQQIDLGTGETPKRRWWRR